MATAAARLSMWMLIVYLVTAEDDVREGKRVEDRQQWETPCFVLCRCIRDKADCSRNYGNLTYIPRLPSRVRILNFSHNALWQIRDRDFFVNVSKIENLDLSDNELTYLAANIFEPIRSLMSLSLINNPELGLTSIQQAVFSVKTLSALFLSNIGLTTLPVDVFVTYPLLRLQKLHLGSNGFYLQNLTVFSQLPKLTNLMIEEAVVVQAATSSPIKCQHITLMASGLHHFPVTCQNGRSVFPHLITLSVQSNYMKQLPKDICLPELRALYLDKNLFTQLIPGMFGSDIFPKLQLISLGSMPQPPGIKTIPRYAFNNSALYKISLMYSGINFGLVDSHAFAGCGNLHTLQVSDNNFVNVTDAKFHKLFSPLPNLKYLYLGTCQISQISQNTFDRCLSLQMLALYENKLMALPDGAFDKLKNLTVLVINYNQIKTITKATFSPHLRHSLHHIDLSDNPFSCSCELRWFQNWFVANASLFAKSRGGYTCSNIPTDLASFHMPDQACLLSQEVSLFIVIIITLLLLTLTSTSILFRYRWHIRLVLYEAFRGRRDGWRRLQEQNFRYDVFVSYATEDQQWVYEQLLPELEGRVGLRLCVHERDFIPGKHILDNIVDCVEASKKVMMVFSADFARSPWCQFELTLCLTHVMDNDDALLVVRLHDVASRDMTSAMMAVMKTTTYIEWGEGADAGESFWGRLQMALQEVLPRVVLPREVVPQEVPPD